MLLLYGIAIGRGWGTAERGVFQRTSRVGAVGDGDWLLRARRMRTERSSLDQRRRKECSNITIADSGTRNRKLAEEEGFEYPYAVDSRQLINFSFSSLRIVSTFRKIFARITHAA